ncbi:MAG: hypothetical protein ACE5GO_08670, partial [Anaerolineales bacterium]
FELLKDFPLFLGQFISWKILQVSLGFGGVIPRFWDAGITPPNSREPPSTQLEFLSTHSL